MTENQWPQTPNPATTDPFSAPNAGAQTSFPTQSGQDSGEASSKKEAAKEEASQVANQAASAAQGVAQTAREEVAHVASEAKSSAQDLLSQAKSGFTGQAGTQQQKAAEGIRTISTQLQSMADAPEQQGIASDLIRQAADQTASMASWLENREPGDLLTEVQTFARNRPGTFLLLAAGAGILAGRLTRGLTAGTGTNGTGTTGASPASTGTTGTGTTSPAGYTGLGSGDPYRAQDSYGAVPPPPVQMPAAAPAGSYGGGTPNSFSDPTRPAGSGDSPQVVEEEPWSGTRTAEDPVGDRDLADDPMPGDPLTRDRWTDGQSGRL